MTNDEYPYPEDWDEIKSVMQILYRLDEHYPDRVPIYFIKKNAKQAGIAESAIEKTLSDAMDRGVIREVDERHITLIGLGPELSTTAKKREHVETLLRQLRPNYERGVSVKVLKKNVKPNVVKSNEVDDIIFDLKNRGRVCEPKPNQVTPF
ncbi:hypothetical protein [Halorubrum sp. Ea8]|uniref:hypothetical protein n=1 Tax=Halorubrum sp. Ea8 TaxID=1383841 RepID=UPI00113FFE3E|nr:hypothetical protein [Halorubrum sp. Ea8]